MHHEKRARAVVRAIESVGEAEVERAVPLAVRVERLLVDRIEALRRLAIALCELRAEPPRPAADRIGGKPMVASVAQKPELELELALEDAHEDRRANGHAVRLQSPVEIGKVRRAGKLDAELVE